jgi:hypothetical protein
MARILIQYEAKIRVPTPDKSSALVSSSFLMLLALTWELKLELELYSSTWQLSQEM